MKLSLAQYGFVVLLACWITHHYIQIVASRMCPPSIPPHPPPPPFTKKEKKKKKGKKLA